MSNNVTLEQLNGPTDQELEALSPVPGCRCPSQDGRYVYMERGPNVFQLNEYAIGHMNIEWIEQVAKELRSSASQEPHEDEELMLRIPLDEGV